jgi:hypothetical protein
MEQVVQIVSFGSAWWVRPGRDVGDSERYTRHAAYFNSTGVEVGSKIHTAGPVRGLVRFNVSSGLDPHDAQNNIGRIFCFTEVERYRDTNRLLALRRATKDATPTHFLIRVSSILHGTLSPASRWRSADVQTIAVSRYRGWQQSLLLTTAQSAIRTSLGIWTIRCRDHTLPQLMLIDDKEDATSGRERHEISQGIGFHQRNV